MENQTKRRIRLIVVDDQVLFARMLQTVFETRSDDFEVIGVAHDGHAAIRLTEETNPDLVLLDLRMPEMSGIETLRTWRSGDFMPKVVVLTTFDEPDDLHEALRLGVSGYILKDCEPEELFTAIHAAYEGSVPLSKTVADRLSSHIQSSESVPDGSMTRTEALRLLNRREGEILDLIVDGLDNKEIAARLFVAEQTIKNNVSSIYAKTGIRDRGKLIKLAERIREEKSGKF